MVKTKRAGPRPRTRSFGTSRQLNDDLLIK